MTDGSTVPMSCPETAAITTCTSWRRARPPASSSADGVVFEAGDDANWGFLSLTSDGRTVTAEYNRVAADGTVTPAVDSFTAGPTAA